MKKLLFVISALICSNAFSYIYNCGGTFEEYYRSGGYEVWPEVTHSNPPSMGVFHLIGAQYDTKTGEGMCQYFCSGCDSQGYCPCIKPGNITVKGKIVKPIINDNTKWRPSLHNSIVRCEQLNKCPWKLK